MDLREDFLFHPKRREVPVSKVNVMSSVNIQMSRKAGTWIIINYTNLFLVQCWFWLRFSSFVDIRKYVWNPGFAPCCQISVSRTRGKQWRGYENCRLKHLTGNLGAGTMVLGF